MSRKLFPALALVLALPLTVAGLSPPSAEPDIGWTAPDPDKLPDDDWGRTVRLGRDLITRTAALIGPAAADPAKRYAGNSLVCQNCHVAAGTQPFGNPLVGTFPDYPNYRARSGRVGTLEDRLQGCMERSMNGRKLPPDAPELTAMAAYLKFLATGRPVGSKLPGAGAGHMPELDRAADPARGQAVYARACASCHGADGQGQRNGKQAGYLVPPLWGADSFNDGAGMDRLIEAANFIHNNMPAGTTWRQPTVSVVDSWDVAAFVLSKPRPHMAGLARDYPDRWQKPVDAPYGPYPDGFSEQQHRLGPFGPIQATYAAHRRGQK
jgi:thiosulfate dehydrogenase